MRSNQKTDNHKGNRHHRRRYLAAFCVLFALSALPTQAHAALYRYQAPDGTTLITTEKKGAGYKLLEVLSGPAPAPAASKPTRAPKPAATSPQANAPKPAFESNSSTRRGAHGFNDLIEEASEAYDVPFGFI